MAALYQVDSEDAAFLFSEQLDNPSHLSLIALYDQSELGKSGAVRFQHILKLLQARLSTAPVLYQKIQRVPGDLDYPYWVDDSGFDIDYHVRHLALPQPGDWRQLCIQVSRLHSRPLDVRRPLWELYVIEGLNKLTDLPAGSFALYLKVHHCAMDEFAAMELLASLHETSSNVLQHENSAHQIRHIPAVSPSLLNMATNALLGNSVRLLKLATSRPASYRGLARQLTHLSLRQLRRVRGNEREVELTPAHFATSPGSNRVFEGLKIPVAHIDRFLSQVPRARLDHALVLICSEATRRYLKQVESGLERDIVVGLQVNTRNAGAHALAGNHMAQTLLDSYPEFDNLVERLTAISGSIDIDSEDALEECNLGLRAHYEHLPALATALLSKLPGADLMIPPDQELIGIASLRGPDQTIFMQGARLAGVTTISPLPAGCGLMYSATLYDDQLYLGFTSDREMLPEPRQLRLLLKEVIETLPMPG